MQTITTKYLGPTDTLGSRVKATTSGGGGGQVTLSWDDALSSDGNHAAGAAALRKKMDWERCGGMVGGSLPKGRTVWVFIESEEFIF